MRPTRPQTITDQCQNQRRPATQQFEHGKHHTHLRRLDVQPMTQPLKERPQTNLPGAKHKEKPQCPIRWHREAKTALKGTVFRHINLYREVAAPRQCKGAQAQQHNHGCQHQRSTGIVKMRNHHRRQHKQHQRYQAQFNALTQAKGTLLVRHFGHDAHAEAGHQRGKKTDQGPQRQLRRGR